MKLVISDIDNTLVPKHDTLSVRAKNVLNFYKIMEFILGWHLEGQLKKLKGL